MPPAITKELAPDFNVAPSKEIYAVMERRDQRQLRVVKWGLIPSWAKDPSIGNRMANARIESAAEKPSFRRAFAKRRAIIPADGYYEWYEPQRPEGAPATGPRGGKIKVKKQPFYIHPADGSLLAMAGLYEIWRDKTVEDDSDPLAFRWTATILTTSSTDELGRIHDRMPLLVRPQDTAAWLDPSLEQPPADCLIPAAPGLLQAYPVSTDVNNVRNNTPQLVVPIAAEDPADPSAEGGDIRA